MCADTKQAEKNYLARSGSLAWERVKPFSPPATDTLSESLRLMHDFAVAVNALEPTGNHLLLDVGAGSCWTSEWLTRLNLRVVAVDIATDMLRVGQSRLPERRPGFVAGDIEALPFPPGVFDRVLCLNALHHMPDPAQALRELSRVLTPFGRLVLIEPGDGHSQRETSQAAMNDLGVLERDLEAGALMRMCLDAGFSRVVARPLSYMTGEIELTPDVVSRWRKWAGSPRPLRGLGSLRRAVLEILGLQKTGSLFENSLSVWISRVLLRHVREQSVIVASKSAEHSTAHECRAQIVVDGGQILFSKDGAMTGRLRIRNTGTLKWRVDSRTGAVRLGVELLDESHSAVTRDFARLVLPHDVDPGNECVVHVALVRPSGIQARYLKFDLVAEGVTWFERQGSTPLALEIPATAATGSN